MSTALLLTAALLPSEALADEGSEDFDAAMETRLGDGEHLELAAACMPSQQKCQCPNGAWSTTTCDATGLFTVCACASANIDVPSFNIPNIDFDKPKKPKPKKRSSGVGMLIGGLITLGLGATSLGIGVQMIRDETVVPLGVVLTATGGVAMLVGLPLSIVGLVRVAQGDSRGAYQGELELPPPVWIGPNGVGFAF